MHWFALGSNVVSLDKKKPKKCPTCHGRGRSTWGGLCITCGGMGTIDDDDDNDADYSSAPATSSPASSA